MAHNLAMFEGPHRNRNIMIIVAVVVIAAVIVLYLTDRLPGIAGAPSPSCRVGRLSWRPRHCFAAPPSFVISITPSLSP